MFGMGIIASFVRLKLALKLRFQLGEFKRHTSKMSGTIDTSQIDTLFLFASSILIFYYPLLNDAVSHD